MQDILHPSFHHISLCLLRGPVLDPPRGELLLVALPVPSGHARHVGQVSASAQPTHLPSSLPRLQGTVPLL